MPCTVTEILSYCPNKYLSGSSSSFNAGCAFWRWLAHLNDTLFPKPFRCKWLLSQDHWMQNPILFKYSLKGKKTPAYSLYCHNMLFVYYFFMHCLYLLGFLQSFSFSYGNFTYIDNMFYHLFSLLFLHFWVFFITLPVSALHGCFSTALLDLPAQDRLSSWLICCSLLWGQRTGPSLTQLLSRWDWDF